VCEGEGGGGGGGGGNLFCNWREPSKSNDILNPRNNVDVKEKEL